MPIRILEEAFEETAEAAAWYERECPGLGDEFFEAVEAAFDLVEDGSLPLLPMLNKTKLKDVKRLILKGTSKNSDFFVSARRPRAENRSV